MERFVKNCLTRILCFQGRNYKCYFIDNRRPIRDFKVRREESTLFLEETMLPRLWEMH